MTQTKQHHRLSALTVARRALFITIGALLMSVGLEIFLVPNHIIDGGITGISILLAHVMQVPLGLFLFVLNIPFLIIGYKQIGKTFTLSTLYGVTVMSLGTYFLHPVAPLTPNLFLASIFGGLVLGMGVGIVIRFGGSLDGTEIAAILLVKKLPFSVGEVVMFFNFFILSSAGFVFGWDSAMYSLIAYFIAYKMIDIAIEGFDESKSVWIISEEWQEIGSAIMNRLGRGVTYLNGEGGFTGGSKKVIFVVINRLEEAKLKLIVEELDPSSFLAVGNIHDVKGGRFKKRNIH
ncbi:YitT family protein [Paenibacillus protaetiae]|uniref:YitT family protein n=1 Tax=Paenibacillus protaetiae TaxID=2509456 RepID=A0A4P6EZZ1_9BACL|nr:YitT family protein [Paenibacillus protaetiae]